MAKLKTSTAQVLCLVPVAIPGVMKNGVPTPLVMVMLALIDSTVHASPKSDILCVVCCDAFHSISTFCLLVDGERKERKQTLP